MTIQPFVFLPHVGGGQPQAARPLVRPCEGIVTQRWGENPANYARFGLPAHNGLDIANRLLTPIVSVADGVVAYAGSDPDYGNYTRVSSPHLGFDAFYAHMASVLVEVGQRVSRGQFIGHMGSTGNSTGSHIHLEIRLTNGNSYIELSGGYGKGRIDPAIVYWLLNREII